MHSRFPPFDTISGTPPPRAARFTVSKTWRLELICANKFLIVLFLWEFFEWFTINGCCKAKWRRRPQIDVESNLLKSRLKLIRNKQPKIVSNFDKRACEIVCLAESWFVECILLTNRDSVSFNEDDNLLADIFAGKWYKRHGSRVGGSLTKRKYAAVWRRERLGKGEKTFSNYYVCLHRVWMNALFIFVTKFLTLHELMKLI